MWAREKNEGKWIICENLCYYITYDRSRLRFCIVLVLVFIVLYIDIIFVDLFSANLSVHKCCFWFCFSRSPLVDFLSGDKWSWRINSTDYHFFDFTIWDAFFFFFFFIFLSLLFVELLADISSLLSSSYFICCCWFTLFDIHICIYIYTSLHFTFPSSRALCLSLLLLIL